MVQTAYVPAAAPSWERRPPTELGLRPDALTHAAEYHRQHETPWHTDIARVLRANNRGEREHGAVIGPVQERGGVAGLVVRHGYVAAEWGDVERVDMTFSVAKSYLATIAGLALDNGLIRDLDEPVRATVDDGGFDPPHNDRITWRHLLQQNSEWHGTLWDKPDSVDANRGVGGTTWADAQKGTPRELKEPGTYFEYNDVRVNRLALALLRRFQEPLPSVLKRSIMDPIGASSTWVWHGYENSYVQIGGQRVQSVSGGGHWGGGLWASTLDHARFGLLYLRRGHWGSRQLLSERWIHIATTPSSTNPVYGCLWWLNTNRAQYPSAPPSSYAAVGAGTNVIWIDPEHDLMVVARWVDPASVDGLIAAVLASVD
ncbi:MAG: serine hydrolase [Chloroflexota bacterium]